MDYGYYHPGPVGFPNHPAYIYGYMPYYHYHYSPAGSGCCGGRSMTSAYQPPYAAWHPWMIPTPPVHTQGFPGAAIPPQAPGITPAPPHPTYSGTEKPIWDSPESPESPWLRSYEKHKRQEK
ncbi:MAG: hypothetical protein WBZ33_12815 [Thermoactinomyces sp.]|jgi:hypothetical protein